MSLSVGLVFSDEIQHMILGSNGVGMIKLGCNYQLFLPIEESGEASRWTADIKRDGAAKQLILFERGGVSILEKENEAKKKWDNTRYGLFRVPAYTSCYMKELEIDNRKLKENNIGTILADGRYSILCMGRPYKVFSCRDELKGKRKMDEIRLFGDYAFGNLNVGLMNNKKAIGRWALGGWTSNLILIMVHNEANGQKIIKSLFELLREGALAVIDDSISPIEAEIGNGTGLCIINIKALSER